MFSLNYNKFDLNINIQIFAYYYNTNEHCTKGKEKKT